MTLIIRYLVYIWVYTTLKHFSHSLYIFSHSLLFDVVHSSYFYVISPLIAILRCCQRRIVPLPICFFELHDRTCFVRGFLGKLFPRIGSPWKGKRKIACDVSTRERSPRTRTFAPLNLSSDLCARCACTLALIANLQQFALQPAPIVFANSLFSNLSIAHSACLTI